jgi:hypothetical protein
MAMLHDIPLFYLGDGHVAIGRGPYTSRYDKASQTQIAFRRVDAIQAADAGMTCRSVALSHGNAFQPVALDFNISPLRAGLATGRSWFILRLRAPYRRASATLQTLVTTPLPKTAGARIAIIDTLAALRPRQYLCRRRTAFSEPRQLNRGGGALFRIAGEDRAPDDDAKTAHVRQDGVKLHVERLKRRQVRHAGGVPFARPETHRLEIRP